MSFTVNSASDMSLDGSQLKYDGAKSITEEERVQIFARQMLVNRVFVGNFIERRYVEPLNAYRDVIVVDQNEVDLKSDLDVVRKRVDGFYKGSIWIGITGPNMVGTPSGHCIWTHLEGIPFGECWFIIRKVNFTKYGEVLVKVNKVRDFKSIDARQPLSPGHSARPENDEDQKNVNLQSFRKAVVDVFPSLLSVMTFNNFKDTVIFLSVLFMATLTVRNTFGKGRK